MLPPPLELLDRALGYTCGALGGVEDAMLANRTPCRAWSLTDLLVHMDDALDAFTEAALGHVPVRAAAPARVRVDRLRTKAGHLRGLWSRPPDAVQVGGVAIEASLLVLVAAVEITVHGWDVSRSTGADHPIHDALATDLLPVATALVDPDDRRARFAPSLAVRPGARPDELLLRHLGREPDWTSAAHCGKPRTTGPAAS